MNDKNHTIVLSDGTYATKDYTEAKLTLYRLASLERKLADVTVAFHVVFHGINVCNRAHAVR